jgi:hypothetical protein
MAVSVSIADPVIHEIWRSEMRTATQDIRHGLTTTLLVSESRCRRLVPFTPSSIHGGIHILCIMIYICCNAMSPGVVIQVDLVCHEGNSCVSERFSST